MSQPQQPPHQVPQETVATAVASLTKWMKKRTEAAPPNLLADERDDFVILQLSLRRVPAARTTRPRLLSLPHPILAHDGVSVCVISDDRPNSRSPPASDLLDASKSLHRLPISEVIPLSTLRTDYRPYESRRRLASSHDLFIADRAILPLLPRVLGKAFYSTKKAPIGVDFERVGWPEQVRKVLGSAFLYLRTGTCSGIKLGRLDMEEDEIVDNVMAVVVAAVENVPKKWANIRALHLKAVDSVALPIYQVLPELGMKIDVPGARLEVEVGAGEVIDQVQPVGKKTDKKKKKTLRANGGEGVANEGSGKRKRSKKEQIEEVVMPEEDKVLSVKKRKPVDEGQKVLSVKKRNPVDEGQKAVKKEKRALKNEAEASKDSKKGKKDDTKNESDGDLVKGRNKFKKSVKGGEDATEIHMDEGLKDKRRKNLKRRTKL